MLQSISIVSTVFMATVVACIGSFLWFYGFKKIRVFELMQFLRVFLLIGYMACLYILLFHTFGRLNKVVTGIPEMAINITLFASISGYVAQGDFASIFFGVFLTLPLFPLAYANGYSEYPWHKITIATLGFVLLLEPIQFLSNILGASGRKVIDVDDLALNLCGYFVGMLFTKAWIMATRHVENKS